MGFCAYLRVPRGIVYILDIPCGILCIIGSNSWDFVHFRKILVRFCAYLELPHGILCIFGSSSWDFVYFWKFLMGFCAFLEVPHGMLCFFGSSSWTSLHMSISLFLYKIRVFATCILIGCGFRWLQPVQKVIL